MNELPLILASASPRRVELLRETGYDFEVMPSDAEELQEGHLTARELCQVNAYRKARAIAKKHPDAIVLGADTVVTLGDAIFGKPSDNEAARVMLEKLSGQKHRVVTGVCLMHLRGHQQKLFAETTRVTFKELSSEMISAYLGLVHVLDKAGAYAIQEHGEDIVAEIDGSFSNVVGLPIERVREELELLMRHQTQTFA